MVLDEEMGEEGFLDLCENLLFDKKCFYDVEEAMFTSAEDTSMILDTGHAKVMCSRFPRMASLVRTWRLSPMRAPSTLRTGSKR